MGPYGWGKNHSVKEWLFAEGYRFNFFQAVRLLEILCSPEKSALDEGVKLDAKAKLSRLSKSGATSPAIVPDSEKVEDFVRFKSAVGLNFPTSDIGEVIQVMKIHMTEGKFDSPQTVTVLKGQPVKLIITSTDFEYEITVNKLKINQRIEAKQTRVIVLTPEHAGRFNFYCSAQGHDVDKAVPVALVVRDAPPGSPPDRSLEKLHADTPDADDKVPNTEMTVNLMGLAGALGPLDMPTTELIIERAANKDTALKDFLDIFNHRLISLLYRIRKMHRIGLENEPPGQDKISKYLYSLIGLGTDGLMGRMQVRDRSLLHYAGLLSQQPRSIVGLERLLSDYFRIEVKGHQFVGGWYDLDEEQWTKIGEHEGQNNVLGQGAVVVGTRVWDQQAKIEIRLGPLTLQQFLNFIPIGWGYRALCDLTRFYLGDTLDVSFRLVLKGEELPLPMLEKKNEPLLLGWTSWLTVQPALPEWLFIPPGKAQDDSQVELSLSAPPAEFKSEKLPLFFNLPPAQLEQLLSRMKVRSYDKYEVIVKQGDKGESMFAIRSGRVRVTRREEDGREVTLGVLGDRECFGEMSLLLGKHREATVIALEKSEILKLDKDDFDDFAAHHPRWAKTLKAYRYGQFVKQWR
ncbi:MAG TPA: type VI secretion system baseplate subunit TssG [Pyrinomonadaceae bacterium]